MIYIIIIGLIAIADILIKNYIERYYWNDKDKNILGGFVKLHKIHNTGGFLNFMEKYFKWVKKLSGILLLIISVVFMIVLPQKKIKLIKTGLALILGGAISNEYDRFTKDSVTDYFSIQLPGIKKIVFNLGDFAIFAGIILILSGTSKQHQ